MKLFQSLCIVVLACWLWEGNAQMSDNKLIQKGWEELVKDHENKAFEYFWEANEKARAAKNTQDKAESYFYLGICSYGASLEKGLKYATLALNEYHNLEKTNAEKATIGRYKCLQLISTIYSRQKKYDDALRLSKEVIAELENSGDNSGTLGLAYSSLGSIYELKNQPDDAEHYHRLALAEYEKSNNVAYLPTAYCKIGNLLKQKKQKEASLSYYKKALALAYKTENKQAQVPAVLALGKWHLDFEKNFVAAENYCNKARIMAINLSDKLFEIKSLETLIDIKKRQSNFLEVSQLQSEIIKLKDSFYSAEKQQIEKSLEVQFEVSEKNRKLKLISAEKEVSRLTNYLLISVLALLIIVFSFLYFFLKRINKRDKQLLKAKEELVLLMEEQKTLKEQQFNNDLEHKESQLSAITIQMLEKNELLDEIKTILNKKEPNTESELKKLVNKYTIQDNNWKDFDNYFESVNKNFYTRLKQKYPEISANDLKICALIKLNLSIKEMASILNISPDSVKTARHRLRKKLQLTTEENLTDFILSV